MCLIDHHVHIERGPYTVEWLEAFLTVASKTQIGTVGIVEHSTQFRDQLNLSKECILDKSPLGEAQRSWFERHANRSSLSEYLDFVRTNAPLQPQITWGLEVDWFASSCDATRAMVDALPLDFIMGSVHFVDGFGIDNHRFEWMWDEYGADRIYRRYYEELRRAVESRMFDIVGHLDVVKMVGRRPQTVPLAEIDALLEVIRDTQTCVEINTAHSYRFGDRSEYCPAPDLIDRMVDLGIRLTLSSDAHRPDDVGRNFQGARALLVAKGVRELWFVRNRKAVPIPL